MARDEITRMAREAGFSIGPSRDGPDDVWGVGANLERFFHMAQAAEREACAKVCEEPGWNAANWCATQIRARGQA